jgi:hypothetical protein
MKHFRSYNIPDTAIFLEFDEWSNVEEPLYLLPEVWVQVSNIPKDVRGDFIALWSLGSLFGKTKALDMPYTRKHGVLRMLIGCVDFSLIPSTMHVFIKKGFYKLGFLVEKFEGMEIWSQWIRIWMTMRRMAIKKKITLIQIMIMIWNKMVLVMTPLRTKTLPRWLKLVMVLTLSINN